MLTREENELLTRTGPGTPMGSLMRRYWVPALFSRQLAGPDCPPFQAKLMGERLVAFRDTDGRLGLLDDSKLQAGANWTKVAGKTCPLDDGNKPLVLNSAFAMLTPTPSSVSDPSKRGLLTIRPKADDHASLGDKQIVFSGTVIAPSANNANPIAGDFSSVHPVLVDTGPQAKPDATRYWGIALTEKKADRHLWAIPVDSTGLEGTPQAWLDSKKAPGDTVLKDVSAICMLDAAYNEKTGQIGIVLVLFLLVVLGVIALA